MGSGGAKKTNKMLEQQTQRTGQFADTMGGRAGQEYDYNTGSRGKIDKAYWDLYGGIGEGGGGGGGGGFTPQAMEIGDLKYKDPRENEAMAQAREWVKSGGISPEQEAILRARATSALPGFFEGIKRNMEAQGPNVGFGSQLASLARTQGRALAEANLGAESDIIGKRLEGQRWGGERLGTMDESLIGRQTSVEDKRNAEILRQLNARNANVAQANAAGAAAAGARARAGDDAFRNRMAILGELRGLRGEQGTDLAYSGQQLAGLGAQTGTVTSRINEPTLMSQIGQGVNIAAGAAAPFVSPAGAAGKGAKKAGLNAAYTA